MIKSGPAFEVLAKNTLDDGFDASPALVDNEIYPARLQVPLRHRATLIVIRFAPYVLSDRSPRSSRASHALASRQSRITVCGET